MIRLLFPALALVSALISLSTTGEVSVASALITWVSMSLTNLSGPGTAAKFAESIQ